MCPVEEGTACDFSLLIEDLVLSLVSWHGGVTRDILETRRAPVNGEKTHSAASPPPPPRVKQGWGEGGWKTSGSPVRGLYAGRQ